MLKIFALSTDLVIEMIFVRDLYLVPLQGPPCWKFDLRGLSHT